MSDAHPEAGSDAGDAHQAYRPATASAVSGVRYDQNADATGDRGSRAGRRRAVQRRDRRDAELCATALNEAFAGVCSFAVAMARYHSLRDQHVLPMYEFTIQLATLKPPPPELAQLLAAVHGNRAAMDAFVRVNAGVTSPTEFFADENVERIYVAAKKAG